MLMKFVEKEDIEKADKAESMKLIIEIPEELYEGIERRDGALETEYVCDELMKAVDNGTPLPENHGRIVDLDTVTVEEDTDKGVLWLDAPTILEASYGK